MGDTQLDGIMKELFVTSLPVSVGMPNPNAAGLLSLDFFRLFGGGVEFEWTEKQMSVTFRSGKTSASTEGKGLVPIEPLVHAGHLPTIELTVNGKKVTALLSTGSPVTVMNEAAAKLAGVKKMAVKEEEKKELQAAGDVITIMDGRTPVDLVKSTKPVQVKASDVGFGKVPLYVGKIPGMTTLTGGSETEPAIVLGLDVLVQRPSMLLRIRDNEVWFS